jgi:hypothetical protein
MVRSSTARWSRRLRCTRCHLPRRHWTCDYAPLPDERQRLVERNLHGLDVLAFAVDASARPNPFRAVQLGNEQMHALGDQDRVEERRQDFVHMPHPEPDLLFEFLPDRVLGGPAVEQPSGCLQNHAVRISGDEHGQPKLADEQHGAP